MEIPKPNRARAGGRPLGVFFHNPVGYGLIGYWICINELLDDSNAIAGGESCPARQIGQSHDHPMAFVAMFAPSFFTGNLIQRSGISKILLVGLLAYIVARDMNLACFKANSHVRLITMVNCFYYEK